MKSLHIAHVTATFPPYLSGTGNVCFHNAQELRRRGHQVTVYTALVHGARESEVWQEVPVERLKPILRFGNAPLLPQLATRLRDIDIVHLHYPFFGGEAAVAAARSQHIPLIITYHQDVLLQGFTGLIERILRPTTNRWMLRSARRVLFTSADYGQASHARPLLRGREACIAALPNGVDTEHFIPGEPPQALRNELGLSEDDFVVLQVAALDQAHYFKGVPVLLRALSHLPQFFKAVIVGDGSLRSQYQAQADELGLVGRVLFRGRVDGTVLPDYYRMADVLVAPSTSMGEAFGLTIVEAFACGRPAIASNLPGVRTVISPGMDGFLVQPGDVIDLQQKIFEMASLPPERRSMMGASGRQKVEACYTWPAIAAQLENIYESILKVTHPECK